MSHAGGRVDRFQVMVVGRDHPFLGDNSNAGERLEIYSTGVCRD